MLIAAAFALVVGVVSPGCVVSPLPEPPQATIDIDLLNTDTYWNGLPIVGEPGAVSPAGALVRAYDLDSDTPPFETAANENGGFLLELATAASEAEVRLQVISEEARSQPLDVIVTQGVSELRPASRPLRDCLTLHPDAELDLTDGQSLTVTNRCEHTVTLEQPQLRRPTADLAVGEDLSWPLTIDADSTVDVLFVATEDFDTELIVFIEASAPERDRRPITVIPPP